MKKFCPDCGQQTLRIIEDLEDKLVCTCDRCGNMVYIFKVDNSKDYTGSGTPEQWDVN